MENATKYMNQSLYWIIGFIALLMLVFVFAVQPTRQLWKECKTLEEQTSAYFEWINDQSSVRHVKHQITNYGDIEHRLFDLVSSPSAQDQIIVESFGAPHQVVQSGLLVSTYQVDLSGAFKTLTGLIYQLETQFDGARVIGYAFKKERSRPGRKDKLVLTIYIQSLSEIIK